MLDMTVKQHVEDALTFEPGVDADNIGVAVDNGVVTLSGHVPTYSQRVIAEEATLRVKGVKGLAQEIEVRPIGTHLTADDEIAKRIINILRWNTAVPTDAVQVKVLKGWVTLTGHVDWNYQRAAAANAVQGLSGMTGVSNMITIAPKASAFDVRERIERAFKREAAIEAAAIQLSVADGKVTLRGNVHSYSERRAAERAAWAAQGVMQVDDQLSVVS